MTIYAVSSGTYSDYGIRALFSTKEKAEEYIAKHTDTINPKLTDCYDAYDIEEWELDEEYTVPVFATEWTVDLDLETGNIVDRNSTGPEGQRIVRRYDLKSRGNWHAFPERTYGKFTDPGVVRGTSFVSFEHAHKIAVEGRQAYLRDPKIFHVVVE